MDSESKLFGLNTDANKSEIEYELAMEAAEAHSVR
jgi:hypothetical protein